MLVEYPNIKIYIFCTPYTKVKGKIWFKKGMHQTILESKLQNLNCLKKIASDELLATKYLNGDQALTSDYAQQKTAQSDGKTNFEEVQGIGSERNKTRRDGRHWGSPSSSSG